MIFGERKYLMKDEESNTLEVFYKKALESFYQNRHSEAIQYANTVICKSQTLPDCDEKKEVLAYMHHILAGSYFATGEKELCEEHLMKVSDYSENFYQDRHYSKGKELFLKKDFRKACEQFAMSINLASQRNERMLRCVANIGKCKYYMADPLIVDLILLNSISDEELRIHVNMASSATARLIKNATGILSADQILDNREYDVAL